MFDGALVVVHSMSSLISCSRNSMRRNRVLKIVLGAVLIEGFVFVTPVAEFIKLDGLPRLP